MSRIADLHEEYAVRSDAFLGVFDNGNAAGLADNLLAAVDSVGSDAMRWPVSVVDTQAATDDRAWVVSPTTAYTHYAAEEARRYLPGWMARPLALSLNGLEHWLRREHMDRAVTLNQWLLSTNLYPPLDRPTLQCNVQEALQRWPDHALWLRSLNPTQHGPWLEALQSMGFMLLPSRQIYLLERPEQAEQRSRDLQRDLKLLRPAALRHDGLERVEDDGIVDGDYAAIARLYTQLYVEKYSRYSPRYNDTFMRRWHRAGLLRFHGLRGAAGELVGIGGAFDLCGVASVPVVGYDTAQPIDHALYRRVTAGMFEQARQHRLAINFSGGAAQFKRLRGGCATLEYSAVHARHLVPARQRALAALALLGRRLAVPLLRRRQL